MPTAFTIQAKEFLVGAGYNPSNVQFDYKFSCRDGGRLQNDVASAVAFSEAPFTMRTACVSVFDEVTEGEVNATLEKAKYLTAPAAIIGLPERVALFPVTRDGTAQEPLLSETRNRWTDVFRTRLADISPSIIIESKRHTRLPSLWDNSLTPWAETITGQTLSNLLASLLMRAVADLPKSYREKPGAESAVTRAIFHLFTCRVLEDKQLITSSNTPAEALRKGHQHFSENIDPHALNSAYLSKTLAHGIYEELKSDFAFASLTSEMLGTAYENALVSPKIRSQRGIYYTPRSITRYMLSKLPIETIPLEDRLLCDVCCGSGSFLLAGLDRLSRLVPAKWTPAQRHQYLRARIIGFDVDEFAREIAALSLVLADIHCGNGWKLRSGDATGLTVADVGRRPTIAVTNPPFKEIKEAGKRRELSVEIARRLIDLVADDGLIGIVLPQSVLDSKTAKPLRESILNDCELLELDLLANGLFYSNAETAVALLRRTPRSNRGISRTAVTVREVRSRDISAFESTGCFTRTYSMDPELWHSQENKEFFVSPLTDLWKKIERLPRLRDIADVSTGLQVKKDDRESVSNEESNERVPFIDGLDALRPFCLLAGRKIGFVKWLRYGPHLRRPANKNVFEKKKVLLNATRNPGSAWRILAAPADGQMYFSDLLHAVVPKDREVTLEEIVAVLNSPVANAWFDAHSRKRKIVIATLEKLPFPRFDDVTRESLKVAVRQLEKGALARFQKAQGGLFDEGVEETMNSAAILSTIDKIVATAYGLSIDEIKRVNLVMNLDRRPV